MTPGIYIAAVMMAMLLLLAIAYIPRPPNPFNPTTFYTTTNQSNTTMQTSTTVPYTTTINQTLQNSTLIAYALQLINQDRQAYGLSPVTLSNESSGQQHAVNMLQYDYFSHWDPYGMKPYMRYALLGGNEGVTENIAYRSGFICIVFVCHGNIDPMTSLGQMEYNLTYNDSICCHNGHRDNILNPYHNQVSIGVAYDSGKIYLVQDFIDNYVKWNKNYPGFYNNEVYLSGLTRSYLLSSIEIGYDPLVANMTLQQLNSTSSYGYGENIAGVVKNPNYYYPSIDTIVADNYATNKNDFNVSFSIQKQISQRGAGEYTILVWLSPDGSSSNSFLASTYTIFINSTGKQYFPSSA